MKKIYTDADFTAVYEQRRKYIRIFVGVACAYLAFCVAWLIYYISLPYADPMLNLPKWMVYIATVLFVAFATPFLGIKYKRVDRYYKRLYYVSEGMKNDEQNYFVRFEKCDLQKDGVDVISCIFMIWNEKKQEWLKREAYVDTECERPPFDSGDLVRYITQGNFIVEYEILQKKVLEIKEYYEDEYEDEYEYEDEEGETAEQSEDEISE